MDEYRIDVRFNGESLVVHYELYKNGEVVQYDELPKDIRCKVIGALTEGAQLFIRHEYGANLQGDKSV